MASRGDVIGNEADETSPLLGREEWQPATRSSPSSAEQLRKPQGIALVLCLGVFLWALSNQSLFYPMVGLAEDAACKRYHLHHPHANTTQPDDELADPWFPACDIPGVHLRVLHWLQLQATLVAVVGVLVAYPFGVLADKIGRRPVYAIAAAGQSASILWSLIVFAGWRALPVELVLLGPIFQLLGGGGLVGPALLYAMLSDIMPVGTRTMWFFFLAFSAIAADIVGGIFLLGITISWTPWVPLAISVILGLANASLMLVIPETLKTDPTEEELLAERITIHEAREAFVHRTAFREHVSEAWASLSTLVDNRSIGLILLAFMGLSATREQVTRLYLQDLPGSRNSPAALAFSICGIIITPVLLAVIFPLLTYLLTPSYYGVSFFRHDLLLARISALFIPLGALLMGMPTEPTIVTGIAVLTLGVGLGPLLQSLVTHYVESARTARVFTLISTLVVVQRFATEPFFSWLSTVTPEGDWAWLPFLILALLGLVVVVAAVWLVRSEVFVEVLPRDGDDEDAQLLGEESMPRDE